MITYLSLIGGIILANCTNFSIVFIAILFVSSILILLIIHKLKLKHTKLYRYNTLVAISLFALSFTYANLFIWHAKSQLIQEQIEHFQVTGVISSLIQHNENYTKFNFKIDKGHLKDKTIQVYEYNNFRPSDKSHQKINLQSGNRYSIIVSVKPFNSNNANIFMQQGIDGTANLIKIQADLGADYTLGSQINKVRQHFVTYISRSLANHQYMGLIVALVTGEQSLVTPTQWQMFKATGIIHLVSISGLHITLVAAIVVFIAKIILNKINVANIPKRIIIIWIGIIAALLYSILAGFSIPTQRTFYMLFIFGIYGTLREKIPALQALLIAALIVLIIDPLAANSNGFYLSFGLVGVIFVIANQELIKRKSSWLRLWFKMQYSITLASVPLLLYLFNSYSFISPLANLWAIPIIGDIITPIVLISSLIHWTWLLQISEKIVGYAMIPIEMLQYIPSYYQATPSTTLLLLCYCGVILLLIPSGIRGKNILGLVLFSSFLLNTAPNLAYGETKITTLDDDVLIQTTTKNILFLTNNEKKKLSNSEIAELKSKYIENLDIISTKLDILEIIKQLNSNQINLKNTYMLRNQIIYTSGNKVELHSDSLTEPTYVAIRNNANYSNIIIPKQKFTNQQNAIPKADNLIVANVLPLQLIINNKFKNVILLSSLKDITYLSKQLDNLYLNTPIYTNFNQENFEISKNRYVRILNSD